MIVKRLLRTSALITRSGPNLHVPLRSPGVTTLENGQEWSEGLA